MMFLAALVAMNLPGLPTLALRTPTVRGVVPRAATAAYARRRTGSGGGAIPQSQGDNMQARGKRAIITDIVIYQ